MKELFKNLLAGFVGLFGYQLVQANPTARNGDSNPQIHALIAQLDAANADCISLRQQLSDKDELIAELNERIELLEDNVADESDDEESVNSHEAASDSSANSSDVSDDDSEDDDEDSDNKKDAASSADESSDGVLDMPAVVRFTGPADKGSDSAATTAAPSSPRP